MAYAEIIENLAPCGLNCTRCAGYTNGEISKTSRQLLDLLGNYQRIAAFKEKSQPAFAAYQQFVEILNIFAQASCGGCRSEDNNCPVNCAAKTCHREQKVDFCFQCQQFPCDKQIPIGESWLKMNERMRDIGITEFFEEQSQLPRY